MAVRGGDVTCPWSGSESATDRPPSAAATCEDREPTERRRAFCLTRIKSRNGSAKQHHQQQHHLHPAANNNNNIIHFVVGEEIGHICDKCRGGAEPRDGEVTRCMRDGEEEEGDEPFSSSQHREHPSDPALCTVVCV